MRTQAPGTNASQALSKPPARRMAMTYRFTVILMNCPRLFSEKMPVRHSKFGAEFLTGMNRSFQTGGQIDLDKGEPVGYTKLVIY